MRTANVKFKNGLIIPIPVKEEDMQKMVISLFKDDIENKIDTISIMPAERGVDYEKNRHLQCYY